TYSAPHQAGSYEITVSVPGEGLAATSVVTVAEPHPLAPAITITPTDGEGTTMVSGGAIGLTAELGESLSGQSAADLVWEVSGGAIEAVGQHAVYTAPAEAGQYLISASIPGVDDAFGSL